MEFARDQIQARVLFQHVSIEPVLIGHNQPKEHGHLQPPRSICTMESLLYRAVSVSLLEFQALCQTRPAEQRSSLVMYAARDAICFGKSCELPRLLLLKKGLLSVQRPCVRIATVEDQDVEN